MKNTWKFVSGECLGANGDNCTWTTIFKSQQKKFVSISHRIIPGNSSIFMIVKKNLLEWLQWWYRNKHNEVDMFSPAWLPKKSTLTFRYFLKIINHPWLIRLALSGLSAGLRTKGLPVGFPVRDHAWVAGQIPSRGCTRGNHTLMFLPLFPSLKINKILKNQTI